MPPFATLHTSTNFIHARVTKVQAAANLNGLELAIAPNFEYQVTNKTPEYLAKFPHGKIPALETPSGFYLAEGSAIAYYVCDSGPLREQLIGRTPEDRALVQMWVSFSDIEILPGALAVLGPMIGEHKYIAETVEPKEQEFVRALKRLEAHLAQDGKKWLVRDDELSLADLSVAASLYWPLKFFMDSEYRGGYPKTMEWFERLMGIEGVGSAFGAPIEYCEKRLPPQKEKLSS